eukprot:1882280-Rhodomonas_salina.1
MRPQSPDLSTASQEAQIRDSNAAVPARKVALQAAKASLSSRSAGSSAVKHGCRHKWEHRLHEREHP